jgi:hypothetical protein
MAHWRKPLPTYPFNSFAVWTVGTWVVLANSCSSPDTVTFREPQSPTYLKRYATNC